MYQYEHRPLHALGSRTTTCPPSTYLIHSFNDLKTVLQNIEQDPDTYFIELKLQSKNNEKVRFYHGDVFSFSEF